MNAFELKKVSYRYGDDPVLNINNAVFPENNIIALLGANGSGKTTLINLLAGLDKPQTGEITMLGKQVNQDNRQELQKMTGLVQQNPYLFNLNVADNVELGMKLRGIDREIRKNRVRCMLEQIGLEPLALHRAHELSGGEIQKVAIARALVLEPEIILMDEPFTYLDKKSTGVLEEIIFAIKENHCQTVIFSSHDQLRAQLLADHMYTLINGKVIPAHRVNIFAGSLDRDNSLFNTGKLKIWVSGDWIEGDHIAIESTMIVLSREKLDSSMRNMFQGKIKSITEQSDEINIVVEAGERFEVIITKPALVDLGVHVGESVWINFKSSAIKVY